MSSCIRVAMSGAVDLDREPLRACGCGCFCFWAAGFRSCRGWRGLDPFGCELGEDTGGKDAGTKVGAPASSRVSWPPKVRSPTVRAGGGGSCVDGGCGGCDSCALLGFPLRLCLCPLLLGPTGCWTVGDSMMQGCGGGLSWTLGCRLVEDG